jgi:hypothetical protein
MIVSSGGIVNIRLSTLERQQNVDRINRISRISRIGLCNLGFKKPSVILSSSDILPEMEYAADM